LIRLAIVAYLATFAVSLCEAQTDLRAADAAFAAHQYREAAELCSAVEKQSADPQTKQTALLLHARAYVELADFKGAERTLDSLLLGKPSSSEALFLLGYVLERENKPRESLAIYNRAAKLATPAANDLKLVGLDYVLLEDYPDAIQWLKRAVAGDASNAEAWYFLARSYMQAGDFIAAENAFRQTLKLDPRDVKALDNLGLALEAQNRNVEALETYRQAVALPASENSAPELPYLDLGTLLNNENHFSEALPYLQRAAALGDRNIRCFDELSRSQAATGDLAAALASLQRAVGLEPADPRLHFRLSQLYRQSGNKVKADEEAHLSARLYGSHSTDARH
jgi:Flp pilus assembly protein TadD